jgi:ABC-2 type transport system ATP-binding protein
MNSATSPDPLTVESLKHHLGEFTLGPIDLTLGIAQCVALAGGNGEGKSTLLRCLAGLLVPDQGTITLFGGVEAGSRSRRQLAFLPERFSPPHYLTGHEYLDYYLGLCGMRRMPSRELLQTLNLDPNLLGQPVRKLSKGTAQKLGLAAVLATDRPLLLMDEPFSGLDPEARQGLRAAMTAYVQQGGCLLFSTHLFESMDQFVTRVLIIHAGQLRFDGSTIDCCQQARQQTLELAFLHHIRQATN